ADLGKLRAQLGFFGNRRTVLQQEVQVFGEVSFESVLSERREVGRRRRRRRRLMQERRERLRRVTGLDFLHVVNVCGVEQLSAINYQTELRLGMKYLLDSFRSFALPVRPCDHVTTCLVAGGAA